MFFKLIFIYLLSCLAFAESNLIVISDIDNTLKASGEGSLGRSVLKKVKKADTPYFAPRSIFQSLYLNDQARFFYLSLSLEEITPIKDWLVLHKFPPGEIAQRNVNSKINGEEFKLEVLEKYLEKVNISNKQFLFWGDNLEDDIEIYKKIIKKFKIANYSIYIRDLTTHDSYWGMDFFYRPGEDVKFFIRDLDLLNIRFYPEFIFRFNPLDELDIRTIGQKDIYYTLRDRLALKLFYAYCLEDRTAKCKEIVRKRVLEVMKLKEF